MTKELRQYLRQQRSEIMKRRYQKARRINRWRENELVREKQKG